MLTSVLGRWWTRWRTYLRIRKELLTYSKRELFDLGIRPNEIDRLAWEEALHPHR